ncbi:polypeptide N-acetylgalactosaminyltransferase 1-like isoform X2 [Pieris brassicae]|uniref:polypeptide N-acetylgalactosaminyltransferase 1-like isoform X2 n=1 Tax=Pieris brassicae TaxID=7116 RepID=UPI001E6617D2|nr:polypeptide N-acetylgalactosaminyltransferase 1-like isoform X2 [Pieris brassicae]
MKLPVRKCYYVAKVGFFLILVCLILSLFEHYRGGKRTVKAQTEEQNEFEKQILEDETRIIPDLGEGGVAAHLFGDAKRLGEQSEKQLAINVYLSDRIPYNRSLEDHRNPACKRVLYDAELPSASVIIIFHNEPYSVVVRTIWSVVNSARRNQPWYRRVNYVDRNTGAKMTMGYPGQDPSSPFVYLKEIILVDDNSTLPELKGKLSHYIRTRIPPDLIKILRLPDRQGLMRARMRGARKARGDVLIFLDAHCEAAPDWLRPLLQRISHKRDAVVTPLIDVIDQTTFQLEAAEQFQVGGFTFMGHFTWIDVPEWEKKRRGSDIAPTWSPTMAGGLFAINRQYYWELGAYDEQMAGWGGENLEMSFRIWQCGGTLETIPCSRVGHVFRSFHPYGLPAHTDTHGINTARMADVWMDDYAELFYLHRPDLRNNPKIGDVTHRKILREKLKCKSFAWYLQHVYKDKFVPVRDVFGFGRFRNPSGLCLDSLQREGEGSPLGSYPCHNTLEATQYFALSLKGELRDEERCAELQYMRRAPGENEGSSRRVLMVTCHGKLRGQRWRYLPSKQLQHIETSLCLTSPREAGGDVTAAKCAPGVEQKWSIDYTEENDFRLDNKGEPSEQELRLQKLRGQRRISRSLLSVNETDQRRHRKSKKKRKKDKFILKVVRKANNSEEHLEVDIYCKHRTLYPNNSFVRDIVSALNDRDITVINNGRVFEKHRVTPLHTHTHTHKHKPHKEVQPKKVKSDVQVIKTIIPEKPVHPAKTAPGVVRLNQDNEKKIIIEDFVEITPQPTLQPKRKRKHHKKILPMINNDVLKPISIEDSPLEETMTLPRAHSDPEQPDDIYKRYDESSDAADEDKLDTVLSPTDDIRKDFQSVDVYGTDLGKASDKTSKLKDVTDDSLQMKLDAGVTDDGLTDVTYVKGDRKRYKLMSADDDLVKIDDKLRSEENFAKGTQKQSSDGRPVRVVMRSNLTFNIGDEFFNWKLDADDVANLLGELTMPNKTTERTPTTRTAQLDSSSESSSQEE